MSLRDARRRAVLWQAGIGLFIPASLGAQGVEANIGHFYDAGGWTSYRLGVTHPLRGVLRFQVHADVLSRDGGVGSFAGAGTDITIFRAGGEGPYLVAGLSGGLGSATSSDFGDFWGSWSAGAGYDVFPLSFISLGAEGRWRELSSGSRGGFELALGVGVHLGKTSPGSRGARVPITSPAIQSSRDILPSSPLESGPSTLQTLVDSIVATATDAMGRPYTYGGTGADGKGFDCSGLIQYSYGKHGIDLPRRSTDQAKEGRKVERRLKLLAPADILTFSNRGGRVSHVGMYIGDGRFIHSATRGVQVSVLSPDDPYGRWWYTRWVGVRRIVR